MGHWVESVRIVTKKQWNHKNSYKCHFKFSVCVLKGKIVSNTFHFCNCSHLIYTIYIFISFFNSRMVNGTIKVLTLAKIIFYFIVVLICIERISIKYERVFSKSESLEIINDFHWQVVKFYWFKQLEMGHWI